MTFTRKLGRTGFAGVFLAGGLFMAQLSLPSRAAACSCAGPRPIAQVVGDPEILVVAGTIVAVDVVVNGAGSHTQGQLEIHRLFQGPALPGRILIVGGDGANCVPMISDGLTLVLTARLMDGRLEPVPCGHFGLLTTAQGQLLMREVEAAFGQGAGPAPPAQSPAVDLASVAIIAVVGLVLVVLFGGLILAFGRRDRPAR